MINAPIAAYVAWDHLGMAGSGEVVAQHNLVSFTRVGAGSWRAQTSYAPRDTTVDTRSQLTKIVLSWNTPDSLFITANATLSGGKVLITIAMATFGAVATDGTFSVIMREVP